MVRDKRRHSLKYLLKKASAILIITHNNPDPDAMASAFGLAKIAKKYSCPPTITYGGVISRPENQRMVELLHIKRVVQFDLDPTDYDLLAFVDCQPGGRNHPFPGLKADIVIDHHPRIRRQKFLFSAMDSKIGANSTLVTDLLLKDKVRIGAPLATALFYGIKTDTKNLSRGTTNKDLKAYSYLFPLVNKRKLAKIENPDRSRHYYGLLNKGLNNSCITGRLAYAQLGTLKRISIIPEMADLLVNVEGIFWSIALGKKDGRVYFSIRCREDGCNAGEVARLVAEDGDAGGHEEMGGGSIRNSTFKAVIRKTKRILRIRGREKKLLPKI